MRTRRGPVSSQAAAQRPSCAARHAMTPSPVVLTTVPWASDTAVARIRSCCASAERMASGWRSHRRVLPSTSVNRKASVRVATSSVVSGDMTGGRSAVGSAGRSAALEDGLDLADETLDRLAVEGRQLLDREGVEAQGHELAQALGDLLHVARPEAVVRPAWIDEVGG